MSQRVNTTYRTICRTHRNSPLQAVFPLRCALWRPCGTDGTIYVIDRFALLVRAGQPVTRSPLPRRGCPKFLRGGLRWHVQDPVDQSAVRFASVSWASCPPLPTVGLDDIGRSGSNCGDCAEGQTSGIFRTPWVLCPLFAALNIQVYIIHVMCIERLISGLLFPI